jgi:hypothetical protein
METSSRVAWDSEASTSSEGAGTNLGRRALRGLEQLIGQLEVLMISDSKIDSSVKHPT